ncbi:MAG: hypothetical protein AAFR56_13125, partial [Chloroflexota bacterium]
MKRVIIACVLLLVGGSTLTASSPADAQGGRQVWVYFFGWYNEGDWNDPRLQDRPIGRYNSYDDGRIGDQIEMAKGAGIDAFIHTWLGRGENNLTDIVLNKALGQAHGRGFKIGVDPGNCKLDHVHDRVIAQITCQARLQHRLPHGTVAFNRLLQARRFG